MALEWCSGRKVLILVRLVQHLFVDVLAVGLLLVSYTLVFVRLRDRSLSLISVVTITIHLVIDVISGLIDLPAMLLLVLVLLAGFALLLGQLGGGTFAMGDDQQASSILIQAVDQLGRGAMFTFYPAINSPVITEP